MNQQQPIHRRRLTRAEIRRRRRNRAIRRIAGLTLVVCVAVGLKLQEHSMLQVRIPVHLSQP